MRDLRMMHSEAETRNSGKIIAAIIVILAAGAAGVYTYDTGVWKMPAVSDNNLPSPAPVLNVPAKTPPPAR